MVRLRTFLCAVVLFLLTAPAFAGQVFVTNVNDSGPGSLRLALSYAGSLGGCSRPCEVIFNIQGPPPPSGYWTIEPLYPFLPIFTGGIIIDGATQTAFSGDTNKDGPEVVLSGSMAGPFANGLLFDASWYWGTPFQGVKVSGLGFVNWSYHAMFFQGSPHTPLPNPISGVTITGNYIGVDAYGRSPGSNQIGLGFNLTENCLIVGNVISANRSYGVLVVFGSFVRIANNIIGMDATQKTILGNGNYGITLSHSHRVMVDGNNIAGHIRAGVTVFGVTDGISIIRNSMRKNSFGIDLDPAGPTANDAGDLDSGPNGLQNYPLLRLRPGDLNGRLDSTPNTEFDIEIYETDVDAPRNQGTRYLATVRVITDSSGAALFSVRLPPGAGSYITATATDVTTGSTSEFCDPVIGAEQ